MKKSVAKRVANMLNGQQIGTMTRYLDSFRLVHKGNIVNVGGSLALFLFEY